MDFNALSLVWVSLDRTLFSLIIMAIDELMAVTEESKLAEAARDA